MDGFNLYFIPRESDGNGGEEYNGEPLPLHLSYSTHRDALAAQVILEQVYGAGQVEITPVSGPNTYMPGEGA